MEDHSNRIQELETKLEQNIQLRDKAIELRGILEDRNAQLQCDTQIKETQRYVDYFSEELSKLRRRTNSQPLSSSRNSSLDTSQHNDHAGDTDGGGAVGAEAGNVFQSSTVASPVALSFISNLTSTRSQDTSSPTSPRTDDMKPGGSSEKKMYTNLDLLKAETPINRAKVSLKLHELEYKVDVEKKVQVGIRNLALTLERSGSSKRKQEIQEMQAESDEKMALLNSAVRKYKTLYIGEEEDENEEATEQGEVEDVRPVRLQPGVRRPVTGKLQLKILQAQELAHAPTRMFRMPQTVAMVKIDGNIQYRTRSSRQDKWSDTFEMHVDKATEVELLIYDQSGDRKLPIGLLWLKISDIAESLRKQKLGQERQQANWVSAEIAQQEEQQQPSTPLSPGLRKGQQQQQQQQQQQPKSNGKSRNGDSAEGIQAWFDVEPVGRILLNVNFVRENVKRRPMDKLGRADAVRERKGEIHEMNGHEFVVRRFYHIMRCALCGDFMVNLTFQCQGKGSPDCDTLGNFNPTDCGLVCHKKCYTRVVTRCIGRAPSSFSQDGDELKHRIPHRFEPLTIIGANWCCHCGFMLPLGFRGAQRCSECGVTSHTKCAHLVPHFCGMSMDKANMILSEMKAANRRKTIQLDNLQHQLPLADQLEGQLSISSGPSPQASLSTPISSRTTPPTSRPTSLTLETHGFQSIAAVTETSHEGPRRTSLLHSTALFKKKTLVQVNRKVGLDDFNFLAVLGKGNFGKVMLAEEKYTNNLYAIKVLKKRFVIDNDEIESTRSEKRVFLTANREQHPFLINLHSSFQTETRVYFVMEYVSGGDLMMHIQRETFSEKRARFYACEVLLALEYFHKHGIIYRDLKLDNIMLCMDGHIKIADYGLCKENMWFNSTTNTFCGTPEFMAPEILLDHRYGRAVDWWAFGVLLYEMLLGQSPFRGEDEDEIFEAVLEDEILYPINMSRHSVSICQKLLERTPSRRLGSGKADGLEVRAHPFFSGVNWEDMLAKKVTPPFLPTVNSRADTSNFDEEFTREIPILTPVNAMLTQLEQREFAGFSYVADWAMGEPTTSH
ncbi:Serine/threonine kinase [Apophysomyces ossiformis]|uniref:protein kinase C n=1 Tax=Apophysomyces ossiformis TaxID=679940 RepID=A0A8H7ELG5_9FUNG|nr:Serine/threonine kinase [Apophysomyces ossiformis]